MSDTTRVCTALQFGVRTLNKDSNEEQHPNAPLEILGKTFPTKNV